jgi:hypothetical protein
MRAIRRSALACSLLVLAPGCSSRRVTVPLMPPLIPQARPAVFWEEHFDALSPDAWREVPVRHRTDYSAVELDGRRCLRADSRNGASILLASVPFDPARFAWLSWDWRVDRFVRGEALHQKHGSDASARVYVYFETGGLPWQKRNIDYVWSSALPVGTVLESAFSSESKMIIVDSGAASVGQWRTVERNLVEDYKRCFGRGPLPKVIAIGIMTDTDNTGGDASAYFDDLRISRLPAPPPNVGGAQAGQPLQLSPSAQRR